MLIRSPLTYCWSLSFSQTGAGDTARPLPVRETSRPPWLCFPLSPRRWQREALSSPPSTSPGVRVGAGVPQTSSGGRADRKALSPCARSPRPCPAGRGSAIWQLQGFPVASASAGSGPSISSCEAYGWGQQQPPGLRKPPAASNGGRAGGGEEVAVAKTYLSGGRRTDTRWPSRRKTKGGCLLQKGRK